MNGIAFTSFTRLEIWISWFYFSFMSWTIYTRLYARCFQLLLVQRLDCLGWLYLSLDFEYSFVRAFSCPLVGWRFSRVYLAHWLDEYTLSLILCFILISRKTYRRYILASRDFTCLGLLAFLWISFDKNFNNMRIGNSHNLTYVGNPNHIYKTLSIISGTCLEADAFRGIKDMYKQTNQVHDFVHSP